MAHTKNGNRQQKIYCFFEKLTVLAWFYSNTNMGYFHITKFIHLCCFKKGVSVSVVICMGFQIL